MESRHYYELEKGIVSISQPEFPCDNNNNNNRYFIDLARETVVLPIINMQKDKVYTHTHTSTTHAYSTIIDSTH